MTPPTAQTFERFEFKYWAPRARIESGLKLLQGMLQENPSQLNTSLYLDSPRFIFLQQHLSGSPDRLKLRVRYYGASPGEACFFEIKRRQGAVVTKRRAVVPVPEARALMNDLSGPLPLQDEALESFQYLAQRCSARPVLLVRARRHSFRASERDLDVRLTIDHDVGWMPTRAPHLLEPESRLWRPLSGGDALVEVKFRAARPWWLALFIEHLAPWRVSFSKYVAAAIEARRDPFFTLDAA
jgi:hypothetical protein